MCVAYLIQCAFKKKREVTKLYGLIDAMYTSVVLCNVHTNTAQMQCTLIVCATVVKK